MDTKVLQQRTKIMPVEPFVEMFSNWLPNELLPIKELRQKAITLVSLVMCKPSDLALKAVLRRSQVAQNPESSLTLYFFRHKT